jgi:hypothetical protein
LGISQQIDQQKKAKVCEFVTHIFENLKKTDDILLGANLSKILIYLSKLIPIVNRSIL